VSSGDAGSKIVAVGFLPARTKKENIKVYNRQTKALSELASDGRFAAAGTTNNNDAPQLTLRPFGSGDAPKGANLVVKWK
jgi:hypothetical protein